MVNIPRKLFSVINPGNSSFYSNRKTNIYALEF